MKNSLEDICQKLQEKEYKLTPQRKTILKVLLDNEEKHLSAEDIYQIVKHHYPEIGLATVYRTLELLADIDILQKMNFDDGKARYEFSSHDEHHHHHLICLKCGKVIEFNDDLLDVLEKTISEKKDFEVLDHKLKFYGYCSKCK
ncbi:Fur family transcriptional regulator [Desulfitibacter alkalitolerans]|uniref:Fur family transcriptional regulator n=1 Tax=Desulfitibacter alkalitolerans TaxID=264641 RepID=UPI0004830462|nr:transcriptional repressor [Desulfitibacter alkalitolerans]